MFIDPKARIVTQITKIVGPTNQASSRSKLCLSFGNVPTLSSSFSSRLNAFSVSQYSDYEPSKGEQTNYDRPEKKFIVQNIEHCEFIGPKGAICSHE